MSKPGNWYNFQIALKFDRRISSTAANLPVRFRNDRSILNINIGASKLQETWDQLSLNRYLSAGRNGKMGPIPADPPRTPFVPPPPHHSGNTQHKNNVTQKSPPHCGDRSATALRKWKRTLKRLSQLKAYSKGENKNKPFLEALTLLPRFCHDYNVAAASSSS